LNAATGREKPLSVKAEPFELLDLRVHPFLERPVQLADPPLSLEFSGRSSATRIRGTPRH